MVIVRLKDGSLLECSWNGWKVKKVGFASTKDFLIRLTDNLTSTDTPLDCPPDDDTVVVERLIAEHPHFNGAVIDSFVVDPVDHSVVY